MYEVCENTVLLMSQCHVKNVTSTIEPVNPCSDDSDGTHHVMFASRPYLLTTVATKAMREGLGTRLGPTHCLHK